jgi:hypothetical protein
MNKNTYQHSILEVEAWMDRQFKTSEYVELGDIGKEPIIDLIPHLASFCESGLHNQGVRIRFSHLIDFLDSSNVGTIWLARGVPIDFTKIRQRISKPVTIYFDGREFIGKVTDLITSAKDSASPNFKEHRAQGDGPTGKPGQDGERIITLNWSGKKKNKTYKTLVALNNDTKIPNSVTEETVRTIKAYLRKNFGHDGAYVADRLSWHIKKECIESDMTLGKLNL